MQSAPMGLVSGTNAYNYVEMHGTNPLFHDWVVAISSNPNDPLIYLDPWANEITQGKFNENPSKTNQCSHCKSGILNLWSTLSPSFFQDNL